MKRLPQYDQKLEEDGVEEWQWRCIEKAEHSLSLMDDEEKFELALRDIKDPDDVPYGADLDELVVTILAEDYYAGDY